VDAIYDNVSNFDLDDNSYIVNTESFDTGVTSISDVIWKRNSIKANVSANSKTFINFSQNNYPGWRAYVDGKRTKIYMVNGLIQGIALDGGEHTVEFKFIPQSIIAGAIIMLITSIIVAYFILRDRKAK
jgi:uncharacterized membrane protein YfhO